MSVALILSDDGDNLADTLAAAHIDPAPTETVGQARVRLRPGYYDAIVVRIKVTQSDTAEMLTTLLTDGAINVPVVLVQPSHGRPQVAPSISTVEPSSRTFTQNSTHSSSCGSPVSAPLNARVSRAMTLVELRHSDATFSVTALCRELATSREYLSRLVKQQTGCTVAAMLREARVRHATRLLYETSLSIKQIAAEAGFRDSSELDRHFRSRFGVTPSGLRDTSRNT